MALLRIVFEGGAWDGRVTQIDAHGSGFAERWAKDEDEIHVYRRSERVKEALFEHDTREGKKQTTEQATVYELCEQRPCAPMRAAATARTLERRAARLAAPAKGKARPDAVKQPSKKPAKRPSKKANQTGLF